MTKPAHEAQFSLARVQEMLGLSRTVVSGLVGAGFVSPTRGPRNEQRFSFQDLMLLRTAHSLQAAKIPPRKILRALTKLRATLPEELPLTGLRISAVGAEVAVRDRSGHWNADSGQLLMDFEVTTVGGTVAFLQPQASASTENADSCFRQGEEAEASDRTAAEAAYRRAITLAPAHAHAYLNLGAMLCDDGRSDEAVSLYDAALNHCSDEPLIHFNRAVALDDQGRLQDALNSYERCLTLSPDLADAHYNAGCLLEKLGNGQGALRHFSTYRRLQRSEGP